ncbi:MAG TPA: pantoate--beta-alanine ligase [Candidatus Baltobacteraceae bacterium]|jgi:pantoate--beta-alanine ligase|nr:pantoate--beta-alanine ligase [Candidatus Baltobacteraceae bacterium]
MQIAGTVAHARAVFDVLPRPLGFIPTMGALHDGHLALVRRAREECASVAASVFVNPMQFAGNEDLAKYPRDPEGDGEKLAAAGVDLLFAPDVAVMYPPGYSTYVDVGDMGSTFEGAVRPTHFRGVATVVTKLLHVVHPDILYVGQKDAQQTAVLRRVVRDLDLHVRVEVVPTVRESDGLAMSSRNEYLNPEQRAAAPSLYRALNELRDALTNGATKTEAIDRARSVLAPTATPDYFDVVDAFTFEPKERLGANTFVIGAVRFGSTRLLDNLYVGS